MRTSGLAFTSIFPNIDQNLSSPSKISIFSRRQVIKKKKQTHQGIRVFGYLGIWALGYWGTRVLGY